MTSLDDLLRDVMAMDISNQCATFGDIETPNKAAAELAALRGRVAELESLSKEALSWFRSFCEATQGAAVGLPGAMLAPELKIRMDALAAALERHP